MPEVIEDFFVAGRARRRRASQGSPARTATSTASARCRARSAHRRAAGARFGRLGREYGKIVFDKALLPTDPTLEWVTPGHPLFEAVRDDVLERVRDDLQRGAVFYDLHTRAALPARRLRRVDQGRPRQPASPPAVRRPDRRRRRADASASRPSSSTWRSRRRTRASPTATGCPTAPPSSSFLVDDGAQALPRRDRRAASARDRHDRAARRDQPQRADPPPEPAARRTA